MIGRLDVIFFLNSEKIVINNLFPLAIDHSGKLIVR